MNNYEQLFGELAGRTITVENPFVWKTKKEIINLIGKAGCQELIKYTKSCSHTMESTKLDTHCGTCLQCTNRRFSTLASKYARYDPEEMYKINLISDPLAQGDDQTLVESYVKTYLEISTMDDKDFFSRFGESSRILRHLNLPANKAARKIFDLYKRHAREISFVLDKSVEKHAKNIREKNLPDSSLLIQYLSERLPRQKGSENSDQPMFTQKGEIWCLNYEGISIEMMNKDGLNYIHQLLTKPRIGISCLDLYTNLKGHQKIETHAEFSRMTADELAEISLKKSTQTKSEEKLIDARTKKQVLDRVDELKSEIEEIRCGNLDDSVLEKEEELQQLETYLKKNSNFSGKSRTTSGDYERIRKTVSNAISRALSDISSNNSSLGAFLRNSIHSGSFPCYNPDKHIPWQL